MADGLTAHQRYFFDLNGYLVLDGVLPRRDVEHLDAMVEAQRLMPPGPSIESQRFGDEFLRWDAGFRDLLDHPAVLPALRDLLGDFLRLDHAYGIRMAPRSSGLGLHGGGTPFDPSQYYLHRGGRMYNGLTTVTWSLVDSGPGETRLCALQCGGKMVGKAEFHGILDGSSDTAPRAHTIRALSPGVMVRPQ